MASSMGSGEDIAFNALNLEELSIDRMKYHLTPKADLEKLREYIEKLAPLLERIWLGK
jgi:hypothetical protein